MTNTKSGMIQKYPTKYPRMEWCIGLPDFEMVQDFVKNTPWRNREEKLTIQPYHKMAWDLKAPRHEVDRWYYSESNEEEQVYQQTIWRQSTGH